MVTSTSNFVFLFIFISILYPGLLLRQVAGDELEGNHREVAGDDSVEDQNYGEVAGDDSEKESHGDTLARMPCVVHLRHCRPFAYEEEGKPPEDCCNAMKKMVTDKQQCLCGIFEHLGMLRVLNITKDDLQAIPKRCGFNGLDESECMKYPPPQPNPKSAVHKAASEKDKDEELHNNKSYSPSAKNMLITALQMAAALQFTLFQNC